MKIGSLVAGIILLIIAIIGFISASNSVTEGQSFVGQVGRTFSPEQAQNYQTAQYSELAFGGLGAVGLGLLIYGAVAKGSSHYSSEKRNPQGLKLGLIVLVCIGITIGLQMLFPWPYGMIVAIGCVLTIIVYYRRKRRLHHNRDVDIRTPPERKETSNEKNIRNMDILKERLARGEITKEAYDELKKEFE